MRATDLKRPLKFNYLHLKQATYRPQTRAVCLEQSCSEIFATIEFTVLSLLHHHAAFDQTPRASYAELDAQFLGYAFCRWALFHFVLDAQFV